MNKFLYLVLEFIAGGELFTYLRSVGRLETPHAWYLIFIMNYSFFSQLSQAFY